MIRSKPLVGIATIVFLAGVRNAEARQEPADGLRDRVKWTVPAGPLPAALDAISTQSGLSFSVLPEILPPGLTVKGFSHEGSLSEGLDRLAQPMGLRWEPGVFGGIVLLPLEAPRVKEQDWIDATFERVGVELVQVTEGGQRRGLKDGDLIVSINGEKVYGWPDVRSGIRATPAGAEFSIGVRRGKEEFQVRIPQGERIGFRWTEDVPTFLERYEKAGHRDPRWDGAVRRAFEERRKDEAARDPGRIGAAMREAIRAGCRDPLLLLFGAGAERQFGADRWAEIEPALDVDRIRSAYGSSALFARVRLALLFGTQGPISVRERCRPWIECAWSLLRPGPKTELRRELGIGVGRLLFADARFEDCVRHHSELKEELVAQWMTVELMIHIQALSRLGRHQEAIELVDYSQGKHESAWMRTTRTLLEQTAANGRRLPHFEDDRLKGSVGLLTWKARSAIEAVHRRAGKRDPSGTLKTEDAGARFGQLYRIEPRRPFPEAAEVHFFTRLDKTYQPMAGTCSVVFGAAVEGGEDTGIRGSKLYDGVQYGILDDLHLWRYFQGVGATSQIPMPGFANDGTDVIRVYRNDLGATVRCNGAWMATDLSPAFEVAGDCVLFVRHVRGAADSGVFVPTEGCFDNDRIRALMERINDPREKMSGEEALKLWDEAASIAPPENAMRSLRGWWLPRELTAKHPVPADLGGPPRLAPCTTEEAETRFRRRGEPVWIAPDPKDAGLLWCARQDGTIETFDRARYWTTLMPQLRDFSGGERLSVQKPVFDRDAIWFATDRGLFRFGRKDQVFRKIPVAGIYQAAPVRSLVPDDPRLIVEIPGARWILDRASGKWSR